MDAVQEYQLGDWVVHSFYGIGQIEAVEAKCISGEEAQYFRIKTADSTFWMPVEQMDGDIVRPVSTAGEIRRVVEILKRPPRQMPSNHTARKGRIKSVKRENSPVATARLVRDLQARQTRKGRLPLKESDALRQMRELLVREWSIATQTGKEKVAARLDDLLSEHLSLAG